MMDSFKGFKSSHLLQNEEPVCPVFQRTAHFKEIPDFPQTCAHHCPPSKHNLK